MDRGRRNRTTVLTRRRIFRDLLVYPTQMISREEFEAIEDRMLAGYAMRNKNTRGRQHPEAEHPFRLPFQRDRDRIIHSSAFRRLEYKTQVFVNH